MTFYKLRIPIIKLRQSHDCFIFIKGIPIPKRLFLNWNKGQFISCVTEQIDLPRCCNTFWFWSDGLVDVASRCFSVEGCSEPANRCVCGSYILVKNDRIVPTPVGNLSADSSRTLERDTLLSESELAQLRCRFRSQRDAAFRIFWLSSLAKSDSMGRDESMDTDCSSMGTSCESKGSGFKSTDRGCEKSDSELFRTTDDLDADTGMGSTALWAMGRIGMGSDASSDGWESLDVGVAAVVLLCPEVEGWGLLMMVWSSQRMQLPH